jgi:hypothetical protein
MIMIVLLRDLKTGLYVGKEEAWANLEGAEHFATMEAAGRRARDAGEDMAVVLRYDNPVCELALSPAFCSSNASAEDPAE